MDSLEGKEFIADLNPLVITSREQKKILFSEGLFYLAERKGNLTWLFPFLII